MQRKHRRHEDSDARKKKSTSSFESSGSHEDYDDSTGSSSNSELILKENTLLKKNIAASRLQFSDWWNTLDFVTTTLNKKLNKSNNKKKTIYGLIGSGAYVLHGAVHKIIPDDIDLTTNNQAEIEAIMIEIGFEKMNDSTLLVNKYKHANYKTHIDVTEKGGFGFESTTITNYENIPVISLLDTLQSNRLNQIDPNRKQTKIDKDKKAFPLLIKYNKEKLKNMDEKTIKNSETAKLLQEIKIIASSEFEENESGMIQSKYVPSASKSKNKNSLSAQSGSLSASREDIAEEPETKNIPQPSSTAKIQAIIVSEGQQQDSNTGSSNSNNSTGSNSQSEHNSSEENDDNNQIIIHKPSPSKSIPAIIFNKISRFFDQHPWALDLLIGLAIGIAASALAVAAVATAGAIVGAVAGGAAGAALGASIYMSTLAALGGSIGGTVGIFCGITAAITGLLTGFGALLRKCYPGLPEQPDGNDNGNVSLARVKESSPEKSGKRSGFIPQNSASNHVKHSLLTGSEVTIKNDNAVDPQLTPRNQ